MKQYKVIHHLITIISLLSLALLYIHYHDWQIILSVSLGAVYFFSGILLHLKEKSLHLAVVLEYLVLSLLGATILIFISLRT
jgi:hypothetical protein